MLLVDPTVAAKEWNRVLEEVDRVAKRNGASVISTLRYGERKLAFPVKRSNRGTYVLSYLTAPPKAVGKIRADLQLSEIVLRNLVLAHDGELRKEAPKDFETAGPLPPRTDRPGFGGPPGMGGGRPPWEDRGPRPPMPLTDRS
jgi:small subunit ribosomal protein S6